MNETPIEIVGNLTRDPELRYTTSGKPVVNLRVASNPRRFDRNSGQYVDGETNYFEVEVWNAAENVAESFTKGDRVIILGTIKTKTWTPDDGGPQRSAQVVVSSEVGASARYAIVKPQKAERAGADAPDTDEPPF
jgi:single-strand DNA-binding protein